MTGHPHSPSTSESELIALADLPLFWQGRINAYKILRQQRGTPDSHTDALIQQLEECRGELVSALRSAATPPQADREAIADLIFKSVEPLLAEFSEPNREDYYPAADAILALSVPAWHLIKLAPVGEPVHIYVPENRPERRILTAYREAQDWWICLGSLVVGKPTHFMHLQTPPITANSRGGAE